MNKLTPENFDVLLNDFIIHASSNTNVCSQLIKMILEKSQTEQKYANCYAQLCYVLRKKVHFEDESSKGTFLKSLILGFIYMDLIDKIQTSFISIQNGLQNSNSDKKKLIGNLNFISELFLIGVIKSRIVLASVNELIQNFL